MCLVRSSSICQLHNHIGCVMPNSCSSQLTKETRVLESMRSSWGENCLTKSNVSIFWTVRKMHLTFYKGGSIKEPSIFIDPVTDWNLFLSFYCDSITISKYFRPGQCSTFCLLAKCSLIFWQIVLIDLNLSSCISWWNIVILWRHKKLFRMNEKVRVLLYLHNTGVFLAFGLRLKCQNTQTQEFSTKNSSIFGSKTLVEF